MSRAISKSLCLNMVGDKGVMILKLTMVYRSKSLKCVDKSVLWDTFFICWEYEKDAC